MDDNQKLFSVMVQQNKTTIFTVCYMFSKDQEEVNDLFQEVVIRLWQGFDKYKGDRKELGSIVWLSIHVSPLTGKNDAIIKSRFIRGMSSSVATNATPNRKKFYISVSHSSAHSTAP